MKRDFTHTTRAGHALNLTLYGDQLPAGTPCVVYLHGLKGYKDWGFVPYIGEKFAEAGIRFLSFNFSHNGVVAPNFSEISDTEAFARNTLSLEVSEAEEVYQLCVGSVAGELHASKLGVLGHSRGGGIALLSARNSGLPDAVATWAAVSSFVRQDKKERAQWRNRGYWEVPNARTGQMLHLGLEMLNDIEKNAKTSLNIQNAARELKRPLLIAHGSADETVPYYEAEHLAIFAPPEQSEFRLFPGGTHTFGAKEPWDGTTPILEQVLEATIQFFKTHL